MLNDIISEGLLKRIPMTRLWSVDTLSLGIMNCPGISVGALKELAKNRIVEATALGYGTEHQYDDFDDITTLSIAGCGFDFYSFF